MAVEVLVFVGAMVRVEVADGRGVDVGAVVFVLLIPACPGVEELAGINRLESIGVDFAAIAGKKLSPVNVLC